MSEYSPARKLLQRFGGLNNRADYIQLNWLGEYDPDGELPPALEASLPADFQRRRLDENSLTDREQ
jgi:hypothetical protein